jgi:hypothetical protein
MESRLGQKLSGTVKAIAERQRLSWRGHYGASRLDSRRRGAFL